MKKYRVKEIKYKDKGHCAEYIPQVRFLFFWFDIMYRLGYSYNYCHTQEGAVREINNFKNRGIEKKSIVYTE